METNDIFTYIIYPLVGAGGLIWGIIEHLAKGAIAKDIEDLKNSLDISNKVVSRYYEQQFNVYSTLWNSLYDLKEVANALWLDASQKNYNSFVKQLKITIEEIERKSIFIEDENYTELNELLQRLARYQVGKFKLIEARARDLERERIERIIDQNEAIVQAYNELINKIRKSFKKQLFYNFNKNE
jgi:hypothetical protein